MRPSESSLLCALMLLATACSASPDTGQNAAPDRAGGSTAVGSTAPEPMSGTSSGTGGTPTLMLPGAKDESQGGTNAGEPECTPKAIGIVRDFRADDGGQLGHPDFQSKRLFAAEDYDKMLGYPEPGMVEPQLGPDKKPVFTSGVFKTVRSRDTFDQWYRDTEGVNIAMEHELPLANDPTTGTLVYDSSAFFPIDGKGFGNYGPGKDGVPHNFHFTFELHMTFAYVGGELFAFRGDDDLFVFINGRLAIDLGGVHAPMEAAVKLDERAEELGIQPGNEYTLDVFQAERFTDQSNFRLETSLSFTNCKPIFAEPR